jgi:hypothetical protein
MKKLACGHMTKDEIVKLPYSATRKGAYCELCRAWTALSEYQPGSVINKFRKGGDATRRNSDQ